TSRPIGTNIVEGHPALAAIESPPLSNPSPEAQVGSLSVRRSITSPNEERLRNDMPVPVIVQQQDGTKAAEFIRYPKDTVEGDGDVTIVDSTGEARKSWGLPALPSADPPPAPADVISGDTLCYCGYDKNSHALSGLCTCPAKEGFPKCGGFQPASAYD